MKKQKKLFTATFTHQGKRIYVRSSVSQRDAEKKAAKKQAEMESNLNIIHENMTVSEYADIWLETYKGKSISANAYSDYKGRLKNYILPEIGLLYMKQVKLTHLQGVMNDCSGKSKSFCCKMRYTMQGMFKSAVDDGVISKNPSEKITLPKATDGTHRSITPAERKVILTAAETHRLGTMVRTLLYCGLRPQEAIALQWRDVDQINQRIRVGNALKRDGFVGETKSVSGVRSIPIPACIQDVFASPGELTDFVFLSPTGKRYCASGLRKQWKSFLQAVDVLLGASYVNWYGGIKITESVLAPDLTMYCLRHTYCTDLEAAGVPINVARYLMGHSSIDLTARIYTHARDDIIERAAEKISEFSTVQHFDYNVMPSVSAASGAK